MNNLQIIIVIALCIMAFICGIAVGADLVDGDIK